MITREDLKIRFFENTFSGLTESMGLGILRQDVNKGGTRERATKDFGG
jgi:hypothetical protein